MKKWTLRTLINRLFSIFNPSQRKAFVRIVCLSFINSVLDLTGLSLIIPIVSLVLSDSLYARLINSLPSLQYVSKSHFTIYAVCALMVAILIKNLIGIAVTRMQMGFMQDVYESSSVNVFKKVFNLPIEQLRKENTDAYLNRINHLQVSLGTNIVLPAIIICNEIFVLALIALAAIAWNASLFFLLAIIIIPLIGGFFLLIKNKIKISGVKRNTMFQQQYNITRNILQGFTDIKIANTQSQFEKDFKQYTKETGRHIWQPVYYMQLPPRLIEIGVFLCIIILLLYGVFVLEDNAKIITTISLFTVLAYRLIPSLTKIIASVNNINNAQFILDDPFFPYEKEKTNAINEPISFKKEIVFDNVTYKYPEGKDFVIKDCSVKIPKGSIIGIIGKSGTGKTTIVNLLLGFLSPNKGGISIDNISLSPSMVQSWWNLFGYVRQDVFLLEKTLAENIALGIPKNKIDIERLKWAIRLSNLEELVNSWPNGIDTTILEQGYNLSGGQKQRIAIARALYNGAEILVFDEATSAMDIETESIISNSIAELRNNNLTIIIITHRYSSLQYCDQIYMLDNGNFGTSISYVELQNMDK